MHTNLRKAEDEQNSKPHVTGHLMHFMAVLRAVVKLSTINAQPQSLHAIRTQATVQLQNTKMLWPLDALVLRAE